MPFSLGFLLALREWMCVILSKMKMPRNLFRVDFVYMAKREIKRYTFTAKLHS